MSDYPPHDDSLGAGRSDGAAAAPHPEGAEAPAPTSRRAAREASLRAEQPVASDPARPRETPPQPTAPASSAGSLNALFDGSATTEALGRAPSKADRRRTRRGGWIALGIVVVIVAGLVGGGAAVWSANQDKIRHFLGWEPPADYAAGHAHGEALVTISSGDTGSTISQALYRAGVTRTSEIVYNTLVKGGQDPTFYPGVYRLQKEMTAAAAIVALQDPANKLAYSALIREGLTESKILSTLSDSLKIPPADLEAAVKTPADYGVSAPSLEGWLFPALYQFDPGVTAKQVIAKMVARTVQSLDAAQVPQADRQRILTIASIIQREARKTDDFYKVSRVIQNRLAQNMKLQMDSTAQYGYGTLHSGTVSSSAAALASNNPWNTYVISGLPEGPIASPGDTAIAAAMHPADGPWLYFVTVNLDTGETVFSTTYADQQKAVAQWQSWCKANPNSGC